MRAFASVSPLRVVCVSFPLFWGVCGGAVFAQQASSDSQSLRKSATWHWPEVTIFEQQLLSYIEQRSIGQDVQRRVEEFWVETSDQITGPEFLQRLLAASALIEPRIAELNGQLQSPVNKPVVPGDLEWLTSDVPGWLQDAIRLACGRAFAQRSMYDEAIETLSGLSVEQVCDPSSLLFYRAVCEHHLLKKDACLSNVALLLEREDELPARFATVANLMQADIRPLEPDSLDEVSRLMRDVHRRLDLGRVGSRVRDEEQEIVDKLDKLIDQIEQQLQEQKQKQQAQQGSGQPNAQQKPMDDSQIAGGSGPGNVDPKDTGNRSGWGNLPPAQRQQALQRLTEELPSHYRDVIEGYFRQLAKDNR